MGAAEGAVAGPLGCGEEGWGEAQERRGEEDLGGAEWGEEGWREERKAAAAWIAGPIEPLNAA